MNSIVEVPFNGQTITAQQIHGIIYVALKPVCANIGVNFNGQYQRLKNQPWAVMCVIHTTGSDGKTYDMIAIDRRTFTMWLATIDTARLKNAKAKDAVIKYQRQAADVLDLFFSTATALNDEHLIESRHYERMQQIETLKAAIGLVHADYLEAKARIVLARELGEAPDLDPRTRPLYTQDFLHEKNLSNREVSRKAPVFGKKLKKAYMAAHQHEPLRSDLTLPNGRIIQVNAYTEADRPLFNQVYEEMTAA
jgi:hypothetical protein